MVSENLGDTIQWHIRAHAHSSVGALGLLWTYFDHYGLKEKADKVNEAIDLFNGFSETDDIEGHYNELSESVDEIEVMIKDASLEGSKEKEMLSVLSGVKDNLERIKAIMDNPSYSEVFSISDIVLSALVQVSKKYPGTLYGDIIGGDDGKVKVEASIPDDRIKVPGYKVDLMFYNLIVNAVEASSSVIRIDLEVDEDVVVFGVSDDGKGLTDANIEKINSSKPFTTKEGGHGKGLQIVREVIDELDGEINVRKEKGMVKFSGFFRVVE
ncbi:MAG: ATP-binding protein [Nanobdellota archaeon]